MSKVITPTIGRRVWFWESGGKRALYEASIKAGNDIPSVQPEDAGVCYVWSPRMVNVTVANQNGFIRSRTSVPLIQAGDHWDESTGEHCSWMPFQLGQAAAPPKALE